MTYDRVVGGLLLLIVAICIASVGGCSYWEPPASEIVIGGWILHFEPYPMGGGGEYIESRIVNVVNHDDGSVWVAVENKRHIETMWVEGKTMVDGHPYPGFTKAEWLSAHSSAWTQQGGGRHQQFGPEVVLPPQPPAEIVPDAAPKGK